MFEEKVKVNSRGDALRIKVLYDFIDNNAYMQDNLTDFIRFGTANGLYASVAVLQRKYDLDFDDASLIKEALLESGVAVLLEDQCVGEFAITKEQAAELADELDSYENPHVIHVATLANPHEPLIDERNLEIIKRRIRESAPVLLGTYFCEKGRNGVLLPFPEITTWAIVEDGGEKRVVLVHDVLMLDILFCGLIFEYGECELKKGKIWKMPKPVTDLLASDRLVFQGLGEYAEVLTEEKFEKMREIEDKEFELLNKIGL